MKTPHDLVKAVDKEVHRWHMHRTKDWSKKKIAKMGMLLDSSAYLSTVATARISYELAPLIIPFSCVLGVDFAQNQKYNKFGKDLDKRGETVRISERYYEKIEGIFSIVRPYIFLTGVTLAGKCVYDLVNLVANNDPINTTELASCALFASTAFQTASSAYIRDRDPKLLQKDNAFKRAYNWVTDKLTPTPVPSYQTLVERLE